MSTLKERVEKLEELKGILLELCEIIENELGVSTLQIRKKIKALYKN